MWATIGSFKLYDVSICFYESPKVIVLACYNQWRNIICYPYNNKCVYMCSMNYHFLFQDRLLDALPKLVSRLSSDADR